MTPSLRGHLLPESREELLELLDRGDALYAVCNICHLPFTGAERDRVSSRAGWRETQISGTCEVCWDSLFSYEDR